jgi:hypothetical protein
LAKTAELACIIRNEGGKWELALDSQAQASMMDIIGMSFIPMYKVVGPFLFFMSPLLTVWGGFRLVMTVSSEWILSQSLKDMEPESLQLFGACCFSKQYPSSIGVTVGHMLNAKASSDHTVEGRADQTDDETTIDRLTSKYP